MNADVLTFGATDNARESANSVIVGAGNGGSNSSDRDELLSDPVLTANDTGFKPLRTVPAFSIHLFVSIVISFIGILLAVAWPDDKRCDAYFVMLYLRGTFYVLTLIFDHVVKKHHDDLRLRGYHEFHRATAMQKSLPLNIVALWNSVLLAVQAGIHHYYGDQFWMHCVQDFFSPIVYVTAFNLLETVVLTAVHGSYISKVAKFNKAAPPPDALRGGNNTSGSLGLIQPGGNTAELLEKQADLINYLKDHNQKLNQKLHQLQLNTRSINLPQ